MATQTSYPCRPWVTGQDVMECCGDPDGDVGMYEVAAMSATRILYMLTNTMWAGVSAHSVRPCTDCCSAGWNGSRISLAGGWWTPTDLVGGQPVPYDPGQYGTVKCCGACQSSGCSLDTIRVAGPVFEVTRVWIDGMIQPIDCYDVSERNRIVSLCGPWPCTNDLRRLPSDPRPPEACAPAWQIDYLVGTPPPPDGVEMAKRLACELNLSYCGSGACRLPRWVTQVQRRGVTMDMQQTDMALKFFEAGFTGLEEVDMWINAVRGGVWRPRRATVRRADAPRRKGIQRAM